MATLSATKYTFVQWHYIITGSFIYSFTVHLPSWVFNGVWNCQVSSQIVSQQYHRVQTNFGPPLLYRLHKLVLCLLSIGGEQRPAALSESQQVQGKNGPLLGKNAQVLSPKAHTTPKPMEQNHGGFIFDMLIAKGQGPQVVAVGDGDILFREIAVYTLRHKKRGRKESYAKVIKILALFFLKSNSYTTLASCNLLWIPSYNFINYWWFICLVSAWCSCTRA